VFVLTFFLFSVLLLFFAFVSLEGLGGQGTGLGVRRVGNYYLFSSIWARIDMFVGWGVLRGGRSPYWGPGGDARRGPWPLQHCRSGPIRAGCGPAEKLAGASSAFERRSGLLFRLGRIPLDVTQGRVLENGVVGGFYCRGARGSCASCSLRINRKQGGGRTAGKRVAAARTGGGPRAERPHPAPSSQQGWASWNFLRGAVRDD